MWDAERQLHSSIQFLVNTGKWIVLWLLHPNTPFFGALPPFPIGSPLGTHCPYSPVAILLVASRTANSLSFFFFCLLGEHSPMMDAQNALYSHFYCIYDVGLNSNPDKRVGRSCLLGSLEKHNTPSSLDIVLSAWHTWDCCSILPIWGNGRDDSIWDLGCKLLGTWNMFSMKNSVFIQRQVACSSLAK